MFQFFDTKQNGRSVKKGIHLFNLCIHVTNRSNLLTSVYELQFGWCLRPHGGQGCVRFILIECAAGPYNLSHLVLQKVAS